MPKYQVKPGFVFGAHNQHKVGDVVEMSEGEALPFLDKLTLLANETGGRELVTSAPVLFATGDDYLPDGFPSQEELLTAGYTTVTAVREATDAELTAVKGIGSASLKKIREAL